MVDINLNVDNDQSDWMVDINLRKMEIGGGSLLQMQGHSFTSVGISATQEEMVEVINS